MQARKWKKREKTHGKAASSGRLDGRRASSAAAEKKNPAGPEPDGGSAESIEWKCPLFVFGVRLGHGRAAEAGTAAETAAHAAAGDTGTAAETAALGDKIDSLRKSVEAGMFHNLETELYNLSKRFGATPSEFEAEELAEEVSALHALYAAVTGNAPRVLADDLTIIASETFTPSGGTHANL